MHTYVHIYFPEITTYFLCHDEILKKPLEAQSNELVTFYYLPSYFSLFEHPNL